MRSSLIAAVALSCVAATRADVQLRIVERTGRTVVTGPTDNQLNLAVQARTVGGYPATAISGFGFNIRIVGESEANGTLARCLTSNADGTYASGISTNSVVGRGGLAASYCYVAGVNPSFNGSINASFGTFTNTPDQEIGLVVGLTAQSWFLGTPGIDVDEDGNPDSWYPGGGAPQPGVMVPTNAAAARTYLGAAGNWVDVYRFRYTVTHYAARILRFRLEDMAESSIGTVTRYGPSGPSGHWALNSDSVGGVVFDLNIGVSGQVPGACCSSTRTCTLTLPTACVGTFSGASTCTPTPCDPLGRCCDPVLLQCVMKTPDTCAGLFLQGGSCTSTCAVVGACCVNGGRTCIVVESALCPGYPSVGDGVFTSGGTCVPNECDEIGMCCTAQGCVIAPSSACLSSIWSHAYVCLPGLCDQGACCSNGSCAAGILRADCSGDWTGGSCQPVTCPHGACCHSGGACTTSLQGSCMSLVWVLGTCSPSSCPPVGACCDPAGACTPVLQAYCSNLWSPGTSCSGTVCAEIGACCQGHACTALRSQDCTGGRTFKGAGSVCGTASNPIACCPANFDRVNGLQTLDILAFIGAWMDGNSRTDFNNSGALEPLDVLDFLTGWFTGC